MTYAVVKATKPTVLTVNGEGNRQSINADQTSVPDTEQDPLKTTILTKQYEINDAERISIKQKWLGREGLQFIWTLTVAEKEAFEIVKGLFDMLSEKF